MQVIDKFSITKKRKIFYNKIKVIDKFSIKNASDRQIFCNKIQVINKFLFTKNKS